MPAKIKGGFLINFWEKKFIFYKRVSILGRMRCIVRISPASVCNFSECSRTDGGKKWGCFHVRLWVNFSQILCLLHLWSIVCLIFTFTVCNALVKLRLQYLYANWPSSFIGCVVSRYQTVTSIGSLVRKNSFEFLSGWRTGWRHLLPLDQLRPATATAARPRLRGHLAYRTVRVPLHSPYHNSRRMLRWLAVAGVCLANWSCLASFLSLNLGFVPSPDIQNVSNFPLTSTTPCRIFP
jgi:hypothetical protein